MWRLISVIYKHFSKHGIGGIKLPDLIIQLYKFDMNSMAQFGSNSEFKMFLFDDSNKARYIDSSSYRQYRKFK